MEPITAVVNGKEKPEKKPNRFVRFLKAVFVHNFGYKLLALGASAVLWILAVAL